MGEEPKKSSNLKCCIGIIIIFIIAAIGFMMLQDNPDHTVTLTLDGKHFTMNNLTNKEINNIEGNNTNTIKINNEDGQNIYMISKVSESTTILNDVTPSDTVNEVKSNGITYTNIKFADGTPSTTVFKTSDGSVYEIVYYNGNDFLFDYQSFGDQMNK